MTAPLLRVDAELPRLPLLDLALDLAPRWGRIVIAQDDDLPESAGGGVFCPRSHPKAAVILLSVSQLGDRLAFGFAHELGHALEPVLGWPAARREAFANRIAPLLLEQAPGTVAEAAPLIAKARRAR